MDRINLTHNYSILPNGERQFFIVKEKMSIVDIPENCYVDILFMSLFGEDLKINIGRGADVQISFLAKDELESQKVQIDVKENAKIECFLADFTKGKERFEFVGNLLGVNSVLNWHLATLSAENDNKLFDISVNHFASSTFAKMDNYGVCKDKSKLVFSGISTINNGFKGSKTHQNSKIMVFDEESIGIAKPILKIDENDIEASHAAVVGKINDDHLFYLTSRGLTESTAKELITYGYLKPIMNGFVDEEIKEEISSLIEGRM